MSTTFSASFPKDMVDQDAVSIVRQLQGEGFETYFVGGCVRDLLLQRHPKDFDIATAARPEELKRVFGRRCRIIGRRFRLVHLHVGNQVFEIATFRGLPDDQELASDDSGFVVRANVFGTPREDAKSRDFTVNGLFYDPIAEQVIDHVGGTEDVNRRLLRTIGDADKRMREDPVRLLRAVKFAARLELRLDEPIIASAPVAAPLIATCPAARVSEELYRLTESGHARLAFEWMKRLGILQALVPEIADAFEEGSPRRAHVLAWLDQIDRLTAAHGTLPREATFALLAWPFVSAELDKKSDPWSVPWGRFALAGVRELGVRLSVPIRHRHTLAGMADVLKRLRQFPTRRPHPHQLRAYGVPLALTVQRMGFLMTGDGHQAYELWASEAERIGLWAAPAEPRADEAPDADGLPEVLAGAPPLERAERPPRGERTDRADREPRPAAADGGPARPRRRRRGRKKEAGAPAA
ncbi:MAG: polynucleotide adenylyltransferase PcnB [Myxococcota bacterium]